jgi:hypothetical protein|nr:hypothetical protein [Aeromonas caviae]
MAQLLLRWLKVDYQILTFDGSVRHIYVEQEVMSRKQLTEPVEGQPRLQFIGYIQFLGNSDQRSLRLVLDLTQKQLLVVL